MYSFLQKKEKCHKFASNFLDEAILIDATCIFFFSKIHYVMYSFFRKIRKMSNLHHLLNEAIQIDATCVVF